MTVLGPIPTVLCRMVSVGLEDVTVRPAGVVHVGFIHNAVWYHMHVRGSQELINLESDTATWTLNLSHVEQKNDPHCFIHGLLETASLPGYCLSSCHQDRNNGVVPHWIGGVRVHHNPPHLSITSWCSTSAQQRCTTPCGSSGNQGKREHESGPSLRATGPAHMA